MYQLANRYVLILLLVITDLINLYAELREALHRFVPHEVMDADRAALAFLHADGQLLCLVLMMVDALGQGIAFGIRQGVANGVAAADFCRIVQLFHSKHDVLHVDVCFRAKSDGQGAVVVLVSLRQVEADGIAPLPSFCRQRLVAVETSASDASC